MRHLTWPFILQVGGQALLAGAGLLEVAVASLHLLKGSDGPAGDVVLLDAAIAAPCVLHAPSSSTAPHDLSCSMLPRCDLIVIDESCLHEPVSIPHRDASLPVIRPHSKAAHICNEARFWSGIQHHGLPICSHLQQLRREGTLEVRSAAAMHMRSHAGRALSLQAQHRPASPAHPSTPGRRTLGHLLLEANYQPGQGAHVARLVHPHGGSAAGLHVHPATGDCCIHLAAVPRAGDPIEVTRCHLCNALLGGPVARGQAHALTGNGSLHACHGSRNPVIELAYCCILLQTISNNMQPHARAGCQEFLSQLASHGCTNLNMGLQGANGCSCDARE